MSKQTSTSSRKSKRIETTLTQESVDREENITKKSFSSTNQSTTTATKIPTKKSEKESTKKTISELKLLKKLSKKQEIIIQAKIDNNNIQKHHLRLNTEFDLPQSINSPKRRVERVCAKKACKGDRETIIQSNISKSLIRNAEINLDELSIQLTKQSTKALKKMKFKGKNSEILVSTPGVQNTQFCLNYDLKSDKKYKFRFRFESDPFRYIFFGVMQKSICTTDWLSCVRQQYFLKRFLMDAFDKECSRNLKGGDLNHLPVKGTQIEMRVDFENDYIDFYDYPEMKNVNANHSDNKFEKGEDYVFTILFQGSQSVVLESFCEISSVDPIV